MSEVLTFLNGFVDDKILSLHTAAPCKIISYDVDKRRANVQPLFMSKAFEEDAQAYTIIEDVPVMYQRFKLNDSEEHEYIPVLRKDDIVLAVFAERSIDDVFDNGVRPVLPDSRHHDITDAIIIGVIG